MDSIGDRLKKHYLPLIGLTLISWLIFHFLWKNLTFIPFSVKLTGYIGIILIAFSLIIGPANILLKSRYPLSSHFRRDIGIYGGIIALYHSAAGLFVHLRGQMWKYFFDQNPDGGFALKYDNFRLANYIGLLAALLIILMLITSNDYSVKKLRPMNWKTIQRLAYFMFPMLVAHALFYKLMAKHLNEFYAIYLPLFLIVVLFQLSGMSIKIRQQKLR